MLAVASAGSFDQKFYDGWKLDFSNLYSSGTNQKN